VERVVEHESAITAKLLKVANSPYYGLSEISSVGRAIGLLGMNSVRSLVLSVTFQQGASGPSESKHFDKVAFWRHTLAVATTAKVLARITGHSKPDEMYCIGMLHDLGLLAMDKYCPAEFDAALQEAIHGDCTLETSELRILGFDHAELGGALARAWNLSEAMQGGIGGHLTKAAELAPGSPAAYIAVANVTAHRAGFTNQTPKAIYEFEPELLATIGLPEEQCEPIIQAVQAEVERAESAFHLKAA
jgi:HD-like signal output (HDOD) protein